MSISLARPFHHVLNWITFLGKFKHSPTKLLLSFFRVCFWIWCETVMPFRMQSKPRAGIRLPHIQPGSWMCWQAGRRGKYLELCHWNQWHNSKWLDQGYWGKRVESGPKTRSCLRPCPWAASLLLHSASRPAPLHLPGNIPARPAHVCALADLLPECWKNALWHLCSIQRPAQGTCAKLSALSDCALSHEPFQIQTWNLKRKKRGTGRLSFIRTRDVKAPEKFGKTRSGTHPPGAQGRQLLAVRSWLRTLEGRTSQQMPSSILELVTEAWQKPLPSLQWTLQAQ